jgi:arylformamidase
LDAPFHFIPDGKRLQEINLDDLIGPALVVDVSGVEGAITRRDLEQHGIGGAQRVLLKTRSGSWMEQPSFRNDFSALAPDGAQFLVDSGVRLAGIDYLSIEPFGSPDHQTHEILLGHEVVVVEGLDMSGLCAGEVEFICLPLKILDGDGSPCRAVARPIGSNR